MTETILLKNILLTEDFFTLPSRIDELENNILQYQQPNLIYQQDFFSGAGNEIIFGKGTGSAVSDATSETTSDLTPAADSRATAFSNAMAVGIVNYANIYTGEGNDTILGIAEVSGISTATAQTESALSNVYFTNVKDTSVATVNVVVDAVGIRNTNNISTDKGNDTIVGVANASASGKSTATSQAELVVGNNSAVAANSKAEVVVETLAIGLENTGKIYTGEGRDLVIGVANASAMSEAEAAALAFNTTILATGDGSQVISEIEKAMTQGTASASATSLTTTLGLVNTGTIYTEKGNDVIVGIANNKSSSNSVATSAAGSIARDVAFATADAKAEAIAEGSAVGIVNVGEINTGEANDIVIGIAIDTTGASARADALAESFVSDSDAQANTATLADTSNAITIGIDNTSGRILTAKGNDQVIGMGEVGILGGNIYTGLGDDRLLGYGSDVGILDSNISLGKGSDFFQAAITEFDPLTGATSFDLDQSDSIKDSQVFGDRGNDTFEIGNFAGNVLIDGGQDVDSLRLQGNLDNYVYTVSADNSTLTIESNGAILTVQNIEAIYTGTSDQAYSISDFA
ncbi:MAG: hypothetical protein RLZZ04_1744 [Cyanobacteriota bacterium]|jgi:hypothetical protein